jgi:hypothetical protein
MHTFASARFADSIVLLSATLSLLLIAGCVAREADARVPFDGEPDKSMSGVVHTSGLVTADFDGDGRIDLAVLSAASARLKILLNSAGGFRVASDTDAGASASNCAVADFDEDGKLDIAVSHHDTDEVWILLGNGDGRFQAPKKIRVPVKKPHLHMLVAAEVNHDRHADLLLAQSDDNAVWVLLGDGKAGFAPSAASPFATANHPYVVATSDFNGDGNLDFATPNWFGKSVSVFLGDGKGNFVAAPGSPIGGFNAPIGLAAGDLSGDGHAELAVGNDDSSRIQILVGDGKGGFVAGPVLDATDDCISPTLADINGDGKLDVLASGQNDARTFTYWINQGGGKFSAGHTLPCASLASRICVADVNGDGAPDLVAGMWSEATVSIWYGKPATKTP